MVHVVELAACMAPACNLDQRRLAVGRGWPVEPFEPGIPVGMQKAPASAKQRLRVDALTRWQALIRYVTDGRLEMSNNAAERAMKPPVLGRKNYLFCGSDAGGQRAACIYTIIETAKMCGINPQAYLADVLSRIADHPIRQIDTLLPWRWSK